MRNLIVVKSVIFVFMVLGWLWLPCEIRTDNMLSFLYRIEIGDTDEQEYYEGNLQLLIFQWIQAGVKRLFTVEQIVHILMDSSLLNSGRICTCQPTSICENVCFIMDTS